MKILFLTIVLLSIGSLNAQSKVSTKQDSFKNMAFNLSKSGEMMSNFHRQLITGRAFVFAGVGLYGAILGTKLAARTPMEKGDLIICSVISSVGFIIQLDSYKYLRKSAFYLQQAGSTVTLSYVF